MRILLVDDDEALMETLAEALIRQRYAVDIATDGETAQEFLALFPYDLIVLDMLLPDIRGTDLCQQCRQQAVDCPILILTTRDTSLDKVQALDAGADDYVIKPFDFDELCARIRALLRRDSHSAATTLCWGSLSLRPETFEVFYQDQQIHTTPKEYALLELFLRHPSRVHSLDTIIENLWSFQDPPSEDAVRTHIKGLRQKLKAGGAPKDLIETVYGVGYRLKPLDAGPDAGRPVATQRTPTPSELATALRDAWDRAKGEMHQRLSLLETVAAAIAAGQLSQDLQQAGYLQAHKLAGALGCFGFTEGSRLAKILEQALQPDAPPPSAQADCIEATVAQLRGQLIDSAGQMKLAPSSKTVQTVRGTLWLVGLPQAKAQAIAAQSQDMGLTSRIFDHADQAYQQVQRPLVAVLWIETATAEAAMSFLSTLGNRPAVVLTDVQDLHQRLQMVQQGAVRILSLAAAPHRIANTIQQVLRTLQPDTKLVIVDDDRHVLELLETSLGAWGFQVTTLDNPERLPEVMAAVEPDVLVLDIDMAGVSGLEICQLLRADEHWWQLPIIVLTIHGEPEVEQQAFKVGADDFVHKATMLQDLPSRILNRLQR